MTLMTAIDADLQAAYLYTFPYYEMACTRYLMVGFPMNPQRGAVNTLSHRRTLADASARGVTTPNAAIGTYGSNYALRAGVALGGLAALPPEETLYLSATTDSNGQPLNG